MLWAWTTADDGDDLITTQLNSMAFPRQSSSNTGVTSRDHTRYVFGHELTHTLLLTEQWAYENEDLRGSGEVPVDLLSGELLLQSQSYRLFCCCCSWWSRTEAKTVPLGRRARCVEQIQPEVLSRGPVGCSYILHRRIPAATVHVGSPRRAVHTERATRGICVTWLAASTCLQFTHNGKRVAMTDVHAWCSFQRRCSGVTWQGGFPWHQITSI